MNAQRSSRYSWLVFTFALTLALLADACTPKHEDSHGHDDEGDHDDDHH